MKRITVYVDEELWVQFRTVCVSKRTSASRELGVLMALRLQEWQEPAKAGEHP